jgi:hypothetical protein
MTKNISRRAAALGLAVSAFAPIAVAQDDGAYDEREVIESAERFFGAGAEGVAEIVRRVFSDLGQPNGVIEGREGSGAAVVGLRYGSGDLRLNGAGATRVYWRGPSVGPDTGGNASKVFTLVYNMRETEQIFTRFPGVEGSAYLVGGVGVNYQRRDGVTLAPIRAGIGLRLGASIGYLAYSRRRRVFPF